jgi:hypothetical protein
MVVSIAFIVFIVVIAAFIILGRYSAAREYAAQNN